MNEDRQRREARTITCVSWIKAPEVTDAEEDLRRARKRQVNG
jgi:hypothetical protein